MFNQTLELRSRRLAAGFVGFAIGLAGVVYISRSQVKHVVIEEISDVATRSLGADKMQQQAQQMTMQTLQALLQDESLQEELLQLFGDLLTEEEGAALGLAEGNAGDEDRMGVDQGGGAGGGEVVDLDELD